MLKLLVPVDGSLPSMRAIEAVGRLARSGVPLEATLINVRRPISYYGDLPVEESGPLKAMLHRAQTRLLNDAEARALGCGLPLRKALAVEGAAAQEIVRAAAALGVDQIVMGAHGADAVAGGSLVPGSVVQRVLCLAKLPVLLVP